MTSRSTQASRQETRRPHAGEWAEAPATRAGLGSAPRLAQLGDFLRSRRARLTPAAVGLPASGRRRTPGIRREDVAALAHLSVAWYARIEQGHDVHPSPAALGAIADALHLDPAERAYAFRLAGALATDSAPSGARPAAALRAVDLVPTAAAPDGTPPALRRLLDGFDIPALLFDRYWDVVGRNDALAALLPGLAPVRTRADLPPRNVVAHVLGADAVTRATREWEVLARACVSGLRTTLAPIWSECPDDAHAAALLASLRRASPEFRAWWPEHRVWDATCPVRRVYEHPRAGRVVVDIVLLDVRSAPGVTLAVYTPVDEASAAKLRGRALEAPTPVVVRAELPS